jgi:EmrB/QacA subfamily drug resistance transporter
VSAASSIPVQDLDERERWRAFAVAVAVAVLTILDLSKVNVGLPSIEKALHAGPTEVQVIVAGYALAFGLSLVPGGRLGDLYSRKALFVVGLLVFTVCSLLCAIAPTAGILLIARFLQGIGAGLQMPQVLGLAQELFQGEARGRAFGIYGATIGLGTALGPTIGGGLIAIGGEQNGWRLLFWMNVPLGLLLLVAALIVLPKGRRAEHGQTLDPLGIVLLGVTIVGFMLPFVLTTGEKGDSPLRWLALPPAAAALWAFLRWERRYRERGRTPAVDLALFGRPSYRNGLLIAAAWFAAAPATFLLNTLLLQEGFGIAPLFAGMVTIPFALASAGSSYLAGRLVNRWGRALVVVGLVVAVVGFVLSLAAAVLAPRSLAPWLMAAGLLVAGAGGGSVVSPNQTLTLSEVPVEEGGVAGSMAQVGQRVGTAVGVAGATALFFSVLNAHPAAGSVADYHLAFLAGGGLTVLLLLVALALGLGDLTQRRKGREEGRGRVSPRRRPSGTAARD